MSKKILHIISCLVDADGHALFCGRLAVELQRRGHANRILTCPHVDGLPLMALSHPDVEVQVIQGRVRRLLNIAWMGGLHESVETAIARFEPDIVHVHGFWHPVVHHGVMTAKRFGIPVVLSPQGSLTPWAMRFRAWKKGLAWWGYQRRSFYAADVYHACSVAEAEDLKRLRVRRPICTVPIGCDVPACLKAPLPANRIRTVLFLGRLHPKKGADLFVEAWGRLKSTALMRYCENALIEDRRSEAGGQKSEGSVESFPARDWQLVIAGPDEQGTRTKLVAQAEKLGLRVDEKSVNRNALMPECVNAEIRECSNQAITQSRNKAFPQSGNQAPPPDLIFTGPLYGAEKAQALAAADLFVLPSLSENFGAVVPEALACGVPVICTKGAPWSELLGNTENVDGKQSTANSGKVSSKPLTVNSQDVNGSRLTDHGLRLTEFAANSRCGWWIDIGVEPLARALEEAMSLTDEERRAMGENGRRLVEAKYQWPRIADKMIAVYSGIVSGER